MVDYAATNARPVDNVTPSRVIAWADVLGAGKEISVTNVSIFSHIFERVLYVKCTVLIITYIIDS